MTRVVIMDLLPEQIRSKIVVDEITGCWCWSAAHFQSTGYARIKYNSHDGCAHVVVYKLLVGDVPEGLELDHLCRNRGCVNPAHLEPVTHRENMMRGDTITSANAKKMYCIHGHPLFGPNLYVYKSGKRKGKRRCRVCEAAIQRRARATPEYRARHAAYEREQRRIRKAGVA